MLLYPKRRKWSFIWSYSKYCRLVLEPVDKSLTNVKGVTLKWLQEIHEDFAFIPKEISWRFKLYPPPENISSSWAGRFDLISAEIKNAEVQVRLTNSKTGKLGTSVVTNCISFCK